MKRLQNTLLILTFTLSIFLHFHALSTQEFIGDEASPMLLIDRMWDSVPLKDVRFLAYPFLFYSEPYRSIFSGTLLHFFGPDRILLRLPSIIFGLLTFCLLIWIFKKEKVTSWLITLSMISYSIPPLIINDRSGGGDAQARFFFLLTSYLIWQGSRQNAIQKLRLCLVTFTIGLLTMLDTFVLLPGIMAVFWKKRFLLNKKIFYLISGIILLIFFYFSIWLILPYLAYKLGFQHYMNRGLFYYVSRVGEGVSKAPLVSIQSLINYTSLLFTLWIMGTSLLAFKIKRFSFIYIVGIFAWLAVILLNNSSSHIIIYAAFFFYQATIITDYIIKKYPILRLPFALLLVCIVTANAFNLFTNYFTLFKFSPRLIASQRIECICESVFRMYKDHNKIPPKRVCEAIAP